MSPRVVGPVLVVLAALATYLPARSPEHVARSRPPRARVGLVFDVGGRGDKSFNDAAYLGLMRAGKELDVETRYLEPASTEDREAALRLFAAEGMDLVIGVGFIFSSDVDGVARSYPNVKFACVDYAPGKEPMPPNVLGLAFREEEGSFLVGAAAGLLSKSHHVGFVGGMTIPLIRKFEAGYAAGVHASCPDCVVHAAYAGASPDAFKDPAKGKLLAIGETAAGADVIFHASGSTGHGVFEGAKEAHVLAIGVDADQYDEMPGVVVTSMIKRVDVAVFEAIRGVMEGRFHGGIDPLGLAEHGVDWVHEGPHAAGLPREVVAQVEALRTEVEAGRIKVPSE
ncbi:MAG TPA: BMP family ABC transporter substrate-binding protein [Polyangiaceae bacterium]|nr:BMP family ABC transporter substrate-binding protein [Polyangiaceae bacterium]